jgi:hypothetical protein
VLGRFAVALPSEGLAPCSGATSALLPLRAKSLQTSAL